MAKMPQKLAAEFVGTFALIFIGAGAICADKFITTGGGTGPGLLGIALAHGLAIAVMICAVGHVSGGHFNPAVSIAFWVTKRASTLDTLFYWAAQLAGAIAAAYLLRWIVPEETWRAVSLGTPALATDFSRGAAMVLEGVLTFFLVFVIFGTAVDKTNPFAKVAGFAIGLTITADILLGGPLTGAALNPARALGPALAARAWADHGVFWVGPLAGGVAAGWFCDALLLKKNA